MTERKTARRPEGRLIYVGHYFTPEEMTELCRACGILIMDVRATPTDQEIRDACRELVREAIIARIRRRARRAQTD